jgi:anti-anti-sigma regulatory factor
LQRFRNHLVIRPGHHHLVRMTRVLKPVDGRVRVVLPEVFTLEGDDTTRYRLRQIAADARVDELLLDGHAVREVSVRALGLLVALSRLAGGRGAFAVVIDPSPALARFITSLGLTERLLLTSYDDDPSQARATPRSVPTLV